MRRALGLVVLVAAVAGLVLWLGAGDRDAPQPARNGDGTAGDVADGPRTAPFRAAAECRACHADVYAEWEHSYHAMAWTDPMVQALSNGFRMTECIDCHAPQPIHLTGVDQRVAPRQYARSDGVDCISCHLLEDGISVAAVRTVDTSDTPGACRPVAISGMDESVVCAGCHNQHETVDELHASGLDAECQTCHMEPVQREGRTGASHTFPGAHSQAMHRRAVELAVRIADGAVLADVTSVGAGHHVPTDARHRSYNLWVRAVDVHGNVHADDIAMEDGEFRLYYRDDFRPSTQIAHGATRTGRWAVPDGFRGSVHVRLTYALNPELLALGDVIEVHEQEVTVE